MVSGRATPRPPGFLATLALLALTALVALPAPARAQTVDSVRVNPNGTVTVWVDGERYLGLDEQALRRDSIRRDSLRLMVGIVEQKDAIIAARESEIVAFEAQSIAADTLIREQDAQIETMRETIRELERLVGGGGVSLGVGYTGLTGDDGSFGVLGGVGIGRLRVWGLVDGRGAGLLAGVSFPLF